MSTAKDPIDILLLEVQKLSAGQEALRNEGADRGKRNDANLMVIRKEIQSQGARLGHLETETARLRERQDAQEAAERRRASGFTRAIREGSETDAKHASEQAAVIIGLKETQRAMSVLAQRVETQTTAVGEQTVTFAGAAAQAIERMQPSTRKRLFDITWRILLALLAFIYALTSFLQLKGH